MPWEKDCPIHENRCLYINHLTQHGAPVHSPRCTISVWALAQFNARYSGIPRRAWGPIQFVDEWFKQVSQSDIVERIAVDTGATCNRWLGSG